MIASLLAAGLAIALAPANCAELPRPTMRIRLVLEAGVPADLRAEIETRVTEVWRGEGLTLSWLPQAPVGQADPATNLWLRITLAPIGDLRTQDEPTLGVVRFLGRVPRPDVLVSYGAVREWVRRERDRRFRVVFPGMSRQDSLEFGGFEVLARHALAYAAAHEVGHFVLGTKSHDPNGLMRRDLVARTVAEPEHPDLRLSQASRQVLAGRLMLAASCPTSPPVQP